jgi:PAS domain S-box-containing protein
MSCPGPTLILDTRPQRPRRFRALSRERFFKSVLQSISDRVCVLDRNGIAIYMNCGAGKFAASWADTLDKLAVGNSYLDVAETAVRAGIAYAAERLRAVRSVLYREQFSSEVQYPSPSELCSRAVLMKVEPMPRDYGGVIIRWLDFALPKGELRPATDRSLDLLANSAPIMMWRSDTDKACTYFNNNWLEYTGRALDQEVGNGWAKGVHTNDVDRIIRQYNEACDARQDFFLEYRLKKADGTYGWILDRGVPTYEADGTFSGYIGSCIDITPHKRSLEALHESEGRFQTLANIVPVVIWTTDSMRRRIYLNEYWRTLTSREPQESLGFKWLEAVHPDDRLSQSASFAEAAKTERPYRAEYRIARPDGNWLSCLDVGSPQFGSDGSYVGHIGACIDISALLELEKTRCELVIRQTAAQEDERKRIACELHDDISQRLALCTLELDKIIGDKRSVQASKLYRDMEGIASDIHRISHNLHPSTLADLGLVPALRRLSRDFSDHRQIAVEFSHKNIPPQIPAHIAISLFRIAQECLTNVSKHSGSRSAKVCMKGMAGGIQLVTSDKGCGFEMTTLCEPDRGLGITNIRERSRMLGGTFEIKSKRQGGTKVVIWVPVKAVV